ncbi:MAG TPA: copper amine oxidase N-terminal domain-containing protein [Caldisericia bacterium]|nr:copper amine oxidase N-terminal domain-containing protein [Caldisericia bacterium]HPF49479.1 copper amine oxidase N-terminal domain-containing protein [Caldisericia bacterium]HPI84227.1 copper amine oxidase N-terminal domain-containing protein [Caldisericia bacterium]HPQ93478.1 copper amine oxidase N-terminal domain-containing protein [Caldisericia bacterium]HRV75516.1 copper amine oxidase N-terminal domain-containing protein [Caldisericia bacterium]
MKKSIVVALSVIAVIAISFAFVTAQQEYCDEFALTYPNAKGDLKTNCISCHFDENGDTQRNLYGVQYEVNMDGDFALFENDDVDADGFTTIQEINAGTYPGDFSSRPSKKFSKCVSFILSVENDGDPRPYIYADGKKVDIDAPCYIKNNKSMVPLRAGIENLGGEVGWVQSERRIDIKKGGKLVGQMWIGKQTAKINGKNYDLQQAPEIVNSRTFVPVKGVGDALGAELVWINVGKIANFRFK